MSLKQKTVSGFTWSFIEVLSKQGLVFIIGVILARLLTPREFGLIGMTTIFISFSEVFVDSGFGQALVRKQKCTQSDFSTVFYFNLMVGGLLYILLYFLAQPISLFFNEPQLKLIIQVISAGLIIKSFSLIQTILLIKKIDFKTQTKVSVIASLSSGFVGIFLAFKGFGVWSLVSKFLLNYFFITIFLWVFSKWKPSLVFSKKSFSELFSFGSKLLASSLIHRIYENMYLLLIGKYFAASDLGYYTRANQFKDLFSKNLSTVIIRVSYPTLASIQNETVRLKEYYRTLIKSSMLIVFIIALGIMAMAKPIIILLIGEKWIPSVFYLQLLSIAGIFYPIQEINKNMLKVKGRSDIILKLEVYIKIFAIPFIFLSVYFGIVHLIITLILIALGSYLIFSYYAGNTIGYKLLDQLKDVFFSFLFCLTAAIISYIPALIFDLSTTLRFILQLFFYFSFLLVFFETFKLSEYMLLKNHVFNKLKNQKHH